MVPHALFSLFSSLDYHCYTHVIILINAYGVYMYIHTYILLLAQESLFTMTCIALQATFV